MPDDRTFVTELATALGMLGLDEPGAAALSRSPALRLTGDEWDRLATLVDCGRWTAEVGSAFENGRAFLESEDALRSRPPVLIEWTAGRRPPGDEVAPIDLRVDHVFLVSCKYLSANIANPSPARLFDGLLATTGDWVRKDWYAETAPAELKELYALCREAAGLSGLPEDPSGLSQAQRRELRQSLPERVFPEEAHDAYRDLCRTVSAVSAARWSGSLERFGNRELMLWRLLRIGSAPYFLLGADARRQLRLRVASPWDWRQHFKLKSLDIEAASAGQPQVDWCATYYSVVAGETRSVRGHVEVRWSHGRFVHPPEAKIYIDTPTDEIPGYYSLGDRLEGAPTGSGVQLELFPASGPDLY